MDIENYEPRRHQITEVRGNWVRAFVGDDAPDAGEAMGLVGPDGQRVWAAVRRYAGHHTVEALVLDRPDWLAEGLAVEVPGAQAMVTGPRQGRSELDDLQIAPAGGLDAAVAFALPRPDFADIDASRPAIHTGVQALDDLAPVAGRGTTLVLDDLPHRGAFDNLFERVARQAGFDAVLFCARDAAAVPAAVTHHLALPDDPARMLAGLRVLLSWATWLRDQGKRLLIACELPPLSAPTLAASDAEIALGQSVGDVVDQIGGALASTTAASVTTLLRLPLADGPVGIDDIIETMSVGDVDTQIFVTDDGRFDPTRSSSNAELPAEHASRRDEALAVLHQAAKIEDKAAIFGLDDLSAADQQTVREAQALYESLV